MTTTTLGPAKAALLEYCAEHRAAPPVWTSPKDVDGSWTSTARFLHQNYPSTGAFASKADAENSAAATALRENGIWGKSVWDNGSSLDELEPATEEDLREVDALWGDPSKLKAITALEMAAGRARLQGLQRQADAHESAEVELLVDADNIRAEGVQGAPSVRDSEEAEDESTTSCPRNRRP